VHLSTLGVSNLLILPIIWFRFDLEDPEQVLGMPVASAILVRAPGEDGKPVVRPYTPIAGDDKGHMDLLVKRYEAGKMSKHIHDLKVGDFLDVKGPLPKIQYAPNKWKKIGMIAGGTGLTPMLQVAHEIVKNPADKTEVSFVFANIAEEDILLRKQLDEMAKKHSNFKVHYVLEKPPQGWTGAVGYVNEDIVKKHMPAPSTDSIVFVCGPPPMVAAISGPKAPDYTQGEVDGILKKLNYTKEQVFKF
jgi:cytochrome-b5 reductase